VAARPRRFRLLGFEHPTVYTTTHLDRVGESESRKKRSPSWAHVAKMPIYMGISAMLDGMDSVPFAWPMIKTIPWLGGLFLLKTFFSGASNTSERNMHGKVVMVTVRAAHNLPAGCLLNGR